MTDIIEKKSGIVLARGNRKAWIDFLRAIAIIFVIFGHQIPGRTEYFVFTSPVKIPLFFMISGYVFNDSRTSVMDFFKNLLRRLIVPWFCLTILFTVIKIPSQGFLVIPQTFLKMIAGQKDWFMICIVVAEIIWFFTRKLFRRVSYTCICSMIVVGMGIFAAQMDILNYAMISRAMLMQLMFLAGFLFRRYEQLLASIHWIYIALIGVVYFGLGFLSLHYWPGCCLDVHNNTYYNYPVCFGMILLGCLTLFLMARRLMVAPRFLCFIGQNTLVYYLLHPQVLSAGKKALALLKINLSDTMLGACIGTIIACVGCGVIAMILNRFLPEVIGKKRHKVTRLDS